MTKIVKWTAVFLSCLLLLGAPALAESTVSTLRSASPVYITVRVEGASKCLAYETHWAVQTGTSALDAVKAVLDARDVGYVSDSARFTVIAGEKDGTFGGWDGWVWCLGNAPQSGSMAGYSVQGGESILLCYADPNGTPPTLFPHMSAARGADGLVKLTLTAQRTTYDADWKLVYSTVPVTGATVSAGNSTYVTDSQGQVMLTAEDSAKASLPLQITAYADNKKPLVVRFASDFTVNLTAVRYNTFSDVAPGAWYYGAVMEMSARGAVNGYADFTFEPDSAVTRAEAVAALARLTGADVLVQPAASFTDVSQDAWYAPYVNWAYAAGVVDGMGGVFKPDADVTRQDLCLMLTRYVDKVQRLTLPETYAAPAFDDASDISAYAAEAVYRLQKAGVVDGFGDIFLPGQNASRAQLCMLMQRLTLL